MTVSINKEERVQGWDIIRIRDWEGEQFERETEKEHTMIWKEYQVSEIGK